MASPEETAFVTSLNRQWSRGAPSNSLADVGVLVHVVDGSSAPSGIPRRLSSSGGELWSDLERPNRGASTGGRISASAISKRMPDMYEPSVFTLRNRGYSLRDTFGAGESRHRAGHDGSLALPFVLLNATAVRDRLSCCYPRDGGSMYTDCPASGDGNGCTPGCSIDSFAPQQLRSCLDGMDRDRCHTDPLSCYNELVLSTLNTWELSSVVSAVGIAHGAGEAALSLAREMHDAALSSRVHVPLLRYDRHAQSNPFSLMRSWDRIEVGSANSDHSTSIEDDLSDGIEATGSVSLLQMTQPPAGTDILANLDLDLEEMDRARAEARLAAEKLESAQSKARDAEQKLARLMGAGGSMAESQRSMIEPGEAPLTYGQQTQPQLPPQANASDAECAASTAEAMQFVQDTIRRAEEGDRVAFRSLLDSQTATELRTTLAHAALKHNAEFHGAVAQAMNDIGDPAHMERQGLLDGLGDGLGALTAGPGSLLEMISNLGQCLQHASDGGSDLERMIAARPLSMVSSLVKLKVSQDGASPSFLETDGPASAGQPAAAAAAATAATSAAAAAQADGPVAVAAAAGAAAAVAAVMGGNGGDAATAAIAAVKGGAGAGAGAGAGVGGQKMTAGGGGFSKMMKDGLNPAKLLDPKNLLDLLSQGPEGIAKSFGGDFVGIVEDILPPEKMMAIIVPVLTGDLGGGVDMIVEPLMKVVNNMVNPKDLERPSPEFEREPNSTDLERIFDQTLERYPLLRRDGVELALERISDADAGAAAEAAVNFLKAFVDGISEQDGLPGVIKCFISDAIVPIMEMLRKPLQSTAKLAIKMAFDILDAVQKSGIITELVEGLMQTMPFAQEIEKVRKALEKLVVNAIAHTCTDYAERIIDIGRGTWPEGTTAKEWCAEKSVKLDDFDVFKKILQGSVPMIIKWIHGLLGEYVFKPILTEINSLLEGVIGDITQVPCHHRKSLPLNALELFADSVCAFATCADTHWFMRTHSVCWRRHLCSPP